MSLIKLGDGITGLKGKVGGVVFTKDGSGLHVNASPRPTKKVPSPRQKAQRCWYCSKKHAEHWPYPEEPYPDDCIPEGTHVIYSLEVMWAHRQPTLFSPNWTAATTHGFWPDTIWLWILEVWKPMYGSWGLDKQLMFWMTLKWFYIAQFTKGMNPVVAFKAAKVTMLAWISSSASAVAVPFLTLWIGLVGLGFYFAVVDWLEGEGGWLGFDVGPVLIRKGSTIWFGSLIRRPSENMYDFQICSPTVFEGFIHTVTPAPYPYRINWFRLTELWQSTGYTMPWWYVYTWRSCRCRFRGKGYLLPSSRLRMQVRPSQHAFWDKPVGWFTDPGTACNYIYEFNENFHV